MSNNGIFSKINGWLDNASANNKNWKLDFYLKIVTLIILSGNLYYMNLANNTSKVHLIKINEYVKSFNDQTEIMATAAKDLSIQAKITEKQFEKFNDVINTMKKMVEITYMNYEQVMKQNELFSKQISELKNFISFMQTNDEIEKIGERLKSKLVIVYSKNNTKQIKSFPISYAKPLTDVSLDDTGDIRFEENRISFERFRFPNKKILNYYKIKMLLIFNNNHNKVPKTVDFNVDDLMQENVTKEMIESKISDKTKAFNGDLLKDVTISIDFIIEPQNNKQITKLGEAPL